MNPVGFEQREPKSQITDVPHPGSGQGQTGTSQVGVDRTDRRVVTSSRGGLLPGGDVPVPGRAATAERGLFETDTELRPAAVEFDPQ